MTSFKCRYVDTINDALSVLKEFPEAGNDYPLTGAVYIGCYDNNIASLLVYYGGLVHFYCLRSHRRYAVDFFLESEKLLPANPVCIIPLKHNKTINFAKKVGFMPVEQNDNSILMSK